MPTSVIEHIRKVVGDGAGLRDGELVGRYVDRRDEAALAALVNRHGPMVWGVCRRLLTQQDAEDAFQATFIVLVRKASSIAQRELVGNWLYGVAHQTALQARRSAARRRAREVQVKEMPDAEAPQDRWADVRPILDEELSRLPDHYRAVIVLCDLEGRTRKEVAAHLDCPEGTVASRLVRARAMLAKRLTQRGVAMSALVLSQNIVSAVPASLVSSTIKAASLCGAVSLKVAALTEGVLKTMLLTKLKSVMAILVVAALVGVLGFGIARGQQKGEPVEKQASEKKVEVPVVKEKAEKKEAIAWGKEVDGLQMGLAADGGIYRPSEKIKLTVKLRNVGKAEVTVTYGFLQECAPQVTTDTGAQVTLAIPPLLGIIVVPSELVIKAGETVTLCNPTVAVESEDRARLDGELLVKIPTIFVGPGNYKIAFPHTIHSHPTLTTGTVEFEVKAPKNATKWGKEVDGVQVGIQFGEDRVYTVGEATTLTVRLRNNGKKDVPFVYNSEYFQKNPPLITDADGKAVKIKERRIWGILRKGSAAPGKEVDLCKLTLDLRPDADRKKDEPWTLYGTGKFHIEYKDVPVVGEPRLDAPVTTYATEKLELEVKDDKKPVEAKQKDKETFTEWGKESGGLQAGLGFRPGEKRPYTHGETVNLVVRVRNVSKEDVKFQYLKEFFRETSLAVTDSKGKQVLLGEFLDTAVLHIPVEVNLAPGKEIELYERMLVLSPAYGTGTIQIQYERVFGNSSFGRIKLDPTLSKLATGKLELEIKEEVKSPPNQDQKQETETFTAWGKEVVGRGLHMGKEVDGLQAGLGFRPGEKRAYSHGETVKLVVRVRNIGKKEVTFKYIPAYFFDSPPSVTDGEGKAAPQLRLPSDGHEGEYNPKELTLAPGKEVELAEVRIELRLESESGNKKVNTLYGTGKFQIHYERLMYSSGRLDIGSILSDLATGKLELEIKPAPPAEKK